MHYTCLYLAILPSILAFQYNKKKFNYHPGEYLFICSTQSLIKTFRIHRFIFHVCPFLPACPCEKPCQGDIIGSHLYETWYTLM